MRRPTLFDYLRALEGTQKEALCGVMLLAFGSGWMLLMQVAQDTAPTTEELASRRRERLEHEERLATRKSPEYWFPDDYCLADRWYYDNFFSPRRGNYVWSLEPGEARWNWKPIRQDTAWGR